MSEWDFDGKEDDRLFLSLINLIKINSRWLKQGQIL